MEAWKAILIAFGGNAALIAVLAWLSKSLISEWLKRTSVQHQIIFSKLHEKRIEAISNIYKGLCKYISSCQEFILTAEHVEEQQRDHLIDNLSKVTTEFRNTFQENKLYLRKDLCDNIESVFKKSQIPSHQFIFSLGLFIGENVTEAQYRIQWEEAFITFNKKVPALLEKLETEFRSLLGAENYS